MPTLPTLLWSTGFIVAKHASPHAPPLAFLLWRYATVVVVLLPIIFIAGARWPLRPLPRIVAVTIDHRAAGRRRHAVDHPRPETRCARPGSASSWLCSWSTWRWERWRCWRARTARERLAWYLAALACIGWLVSVARAHHPLGFLLASAGA